MHTEPQPAALSRAGQRCVGLLDRACDFAEFYTEPSAALFLRAFASSSHTPRTRSV